MKAVRAKGDEDGAAAVGGDSDTYAGFGGLDSYNGEGPTVRILD